MRLRSLCLALLALLGPAHAAPVVALQEDFDGELVRWGLPAQGGALHIDRGQTLVPVFDVANCTIEYRLRVAPEALIELLFRYDLDTDDYYLFRVDTRREGGNPPGFLKRHRPDPPWVLSGERTGATPPADTWMDVKVEAAGSDFRGYVNGELVATWHDEECKSGGFAFRQQLGAGQVDDLKITVPEGGTFRLLEPVIRPADAPAAYTQGVWSADWIWSPGDALTRWFRRGFDVPGPVHEATVVVTCDNLYDLWLNGTHLGHDEDWYAAETYDVTKLVHPGRNVIAARCGNTEPGAAGLLLECGVITNQGEFVHVVSDPRWKVSAAEEQGFEAPAFDDRDWTTAASVGKQPCPPWGNQSNLVLPYLGPKQPLELLRAEAPREITIGRRFEVRAAWRVPQRLTADYPLILTGRQANGRAVDLATLSTTKPTAWKPGETHTETLRAVLLPDVGYLLDPGPLTLGLELRGTFYTNRRDYTAAATQFRAAALPAAFKPGRLGPGPRREGRFTDPLGDSHAWRLDDAGRVVVDGVPYLPLDPDGVYWCDAASAGPTLDALDWRGNVKRICDRGGPLGDDFVRVRLTDHVDATQNDHDFSDDAGLGGKSRVLHLGDRDYRVTAAQNNISYFAYTARCLHPRNPHLMMYQSVNDIERYTTLRIQPPWDNVGGGVYTGREYPCDGRPVEHRFLFYPRDRAVRFTISRRAIETPIRPESGAAVSHVWLFEPMDPLLSRPVQAAKVAGPERRLGMYLTHPGYLYSLYGYPGRNAEERRASLRSFVDYLKFCGVNLLEFNVVDGGDTTGTAYYPSQLWPMAAGNLLAELLPLCEANDIQLLPIITSLSVPEGKFGFTRGSFQIDRYGKPTEFFASRPPLPNPLRPEVQELLIRNLREILDLCAKSPAVPAVGFRVNGKIGLCYGGETLGASDQYTGYSAWDVAEFTRDTGVAVPDAQPTAYQWIKDHCWEQWLDWRCARTKQFWLKCRDLVRGYRPDLLLYASCDMPSETPAWNIYWAEQHVTPLDCFRFHGVDPRMFRNEKGILLQRGMMIAADRYFTGMLPYGRNVEAEKTFHYAPGVTELYEGAEGNACELYHNYWEEAGLPKIGEFRTDFWGAATMYPPGRAYFEPILFSLTSTNCHTLNLFSWERGTYGHEHDLRQFARAFRSLPRGDGVDASGSVVAGGKGLWVRRFGDRLAVANSGGAAETVKLRWPGPAGKPLVEFGRRELVAAPGGVIALALEPWELRVVGVAGP
ncbi:MAG: hypothetical protein HYU66_28440 [Armatimonadetes bacterium]|nr:hypothetical protein [Armatimonadota bacterium]